MQHWSPKTQDLNGCGAKLSHSRGIRKSTANSSSILKSSVDFTSTMREGLSNSSPLLLVKLSSSQDASGGTVEW
uniref:Uncharacterized protein n=1 Tax=Romanomermis culicivorax TaxID=13658 RepID=A0A915JZW2_ROMCU